MIKKIITGIILIAIVTGIILWSRASSKIHYNDEGTVGNSAGNLYNGGLFCEIDGIIYFSNYKDDGALYSMNSDCTDVQRLSGDKAASINADSHYIYYSRRNYDKENSSVNALDFYNSGLSRMSRADGTLAMLTESVNCVSLLYGNTLYYQHYDNENGIQLHRVDIDQKNAGRMSQDSLIPASVRDGVLYYSGVVFDHALHAMSLPAGIDNVISEDYCYLPIAMPDYLYYIAPHDGYSLCRRDYEGGAPETLVADFCFTYNITPDERYLFYQIDGGKDNRIVQLDLTTGISTTLIDGNFKQIHITSKFAFFYDFIESSVYAYDIESKVLSLFKPPVLEK